MESESWLIIDISLKGCMGQFMQPDYSDSLLPVVVFIAICFLGGFISD